MPPPLTDAKCRNAKPNPPSKKKPKRIWDGGSLYLEVQPNGAKYWRWKFRFAGKEDRMAFGVYPTVTLKQAREARDEARRILKSGIDPKAHQKAQRAAQAVAAANTFEALAREWLESVHEKKVVAEHATRNLRRLERLAFPWLGHRPAHEITPAEVLDVLRRIQNTGHVETAHRVKTLVGQILRYGIASGRTTRDVTADLRDALPPAEVKHHAAVTEPEQIAGLMDAIEGYAGQPETRIAMKLLALVFVRPGELRLARWTAFRLDDAEWDYEPSKGGQPMITPLPRQAVEELRALNKLTARRSELLFPSVRSRSRPMSNVTINAALQRMGYAGQMSAHGFRAMARTVLVERLGYPESIVEMQLAHAVKDANGRAYNRATYLDQRRKMLQAWADYLDGLRRDNRVTPLRQAS